MSSKVWVVGAVALAVSACGESHYVVSRSATIQASPEVIYDHLDDFTTWALWNPWDPLDPEMKKTLEGPESGVGAAYTWEGNDKVGVGKMTITAVEPGKRVDYRVVFKVPFESTSTTSLVVEPGADGSKVTWTMEGDLDFMGKLFMGVDGMDTQIGPDFERGLTNLTKVAAEAQAKQDEAKRLEAEAAAAAAAAAAVPADGSAPVDGAAPAAP